MNFEKELTAHPGVCLASRYQPGLRSFSLQNGVKTPTGLTWGALQAAAPPLLQPPYPLPVTADNDSAPNSIVVVWGLFFPLKQFSDITIQFSPDTVYLETASDSTG